MAKKTSAAKKVSPRTKLAAEPPVGVGRVGNDVEDDEDDDGEFVPPPPLFPKPAARAVPRAMTEQKQGGRSGKAKASASNKAGPKKAAAKKPAKGAKLKVVKTQAIGPEPEAATGGLRETVWALNVLSPGKRYRREAKKYWLARKALLKVLPAKTPGLTQSEMVAKTRAIMPPEEFPGTTSSWWMKTAQLDLEARGLVKRDGGKPLRWTKA